MDYAAILLIRGLAGALAVAGVTFAADRFGARWGGILAGFPAVSSTSLFFMAAEHDAAFASDAALSTLFGIVAAYCFIFGFYGGYHWRPGTKREKTAIAILAGFAGYALACALYIAFVPAGTLWNVVPLIACFGIGVWLFGRRRGEPYADERRTAGAYTYLLRAAVGGSVVVCATVLADAFGPVYGGVFSAFPGPALVVLSTMTLTYSSAFFIAAARHLPGALLASGCYAIGVWITYPIAGAQIGTFISFAGYFVAVAFLNFLTRS